MRVREEAEVPRRRISCLFVYVTVYDCFMYVLVFRSFIGVIVFKVPRRCTTTYHNRVQYHVNDMININISSNINNTIEVPRRRTTTY